ncbi:MAG: transporter, family, putative transporter [Candidatus Parcubacteria bacterium]|jgi:YQGE family putative transporter|nr:transporter, family, putative transporter [Candidatus Parcubacteria bacterium]
MKLFAYSQSAFAHFLINVYFWRITEDIQFLVLFNITFAASHALVYVFAGKVAKEFNRFIPLRVGVVIQIFYLGLVLVLGESVVPYIIPIAMLGGIADGLYWSSDNLLKFDLTEPDNRLRFGALQQIARSVTGALLPLAASVLVVTGTGGLEAYGKVFVAAMVCAGLVFFTSFFISPERTKGSGRFRFLVTIKRLWKDRNIRLASYATLLSQVEEVLPILIGLLLFLKTGTELSLGAYQFVTVTIAVLVNYSLGRFFARKNYRTLLIWGGLANLLTVCLLLLSQSYLALIVYGILKSLFSFAYVPRYPLVLDALTAHCRDEAERDDVRVEYVTLLDIVDATGKIIGYAALLFVGNLTDSALISGVLLVCALFAFASSIVLAQIRPDQAAPSH